MNNNTTTFKEGHTPWNKGLKGTHFSPETEFKKGHNPTSFCAILGTIRFRKTKRDNRIRKFIKIAHPSLWEEYAKNQWKRYFGFIIKADIIHHRNGNSLDDKIENLIAMPRAEHPKYHSRWGLRSIAEKDLLRLKDRYTRIAEKRLAQGVL